MPVRRLAGAMRTVECRTKLAAGAAAPASGGRPLPQRPATTSPLHCSLLAAQRASQAQPLPCKAPVRRSAPCALRLAVQCRPPPPARQTAARCLALNPPSSPLPRRCRALPLVWDEELAKRAQSRADSCEWGHSSELRRPSRGAACISARLRLAPRLLTRRHACTATCRLKGPGRRCRKHREWGSVGSSHAPHAGLPPAPRPRPLPARRSPRPTFACSAAVLVHVVVL